MTPSLPEVPEPTEVEIELTNACNAVCTACPRNDLVAPRGVMEASLFRSIVDRYAELRPDLKINRLRGDEAYPFITLAGLGEPTLHPEALELVEYAARRGFRVVLFTNVSRLDEDKAARLVGSGVHAIYVSFWGIEPNEYRAAMKLDFDTSYRNLMYLAPRAKAQGIDLYVTWVNVPELKSPPEAISAFWRARGVQTDVDDDKPENRDASNSIWNRGGSLVGMPGAAAHGAVDFNKEYWCSQLYFTDTICWNGDVLLCSQDYFRKYEVIANIRDQSPRDIGRIKQALFRSKEQKPICVRCRKQREYAIATHPWDAILPLEELTRYRYDLS